MAGWHGLRTHVQYVVDALSFTKELDDVATASVWGSDRLIPVTICPTYSPKQFLERGNWISQVRNRRAVSFTSSSRSWVTVPRFSATRRLINGAYRRTSAQMDGYRFDNAAMANAGRVVRQPHFMIFVFSGGPGISRCYPKKVYLSREKRRSDTHQGVTPRHQTHKRPRLNRQGR